MASPQSKVVGVDRGQLVVQSSKMVDEAKVLKRVQVSHGSRVDAERWKREDASSLPLSNFRLNLRSPHEISLVRSGRALWLRGHLHIVVRAADFVLGAVAAKRGKTLAKRNTPTMAFTGVVHLTTEESFHRNECGDACKFHSPYETWYGYIRRVSINDEAGKA